MLCGAGSLRPGGRLWFLGPSWAPRGPGEGEDVRAPTFTALKQSACRAVAAAALRATLQTADVIPETAGTQTATAFLHLRPPQPGRGVRVRGQGPGSGCGEGRAFRHQCRGLHLTCSVQRPHTGAATRVCTGAHRPHAQGHSPRARSHAPTRGQTHTHHPDLHSLSFTRIPARGFSKQWPAGPPAPSTAPRAHPSLAPAWLDPARWAPLGLAGRAPSGPPSP